MNRRSQHRASRSEMIGEIFQNRFAVAGSHFRAPAGHLVYFAIPLRGSEALLDHHGFLVAGEARGLIARRLRYDRKLVALRWSGSAYVHLNRLRDVPQISGRI